MSLGSSLVDSVMGTPKKAMLVIYMGTAAGFDFKKVSDAAAGQLGAAAATLSETLQTQASNSLTSRRDFHVMEVQYNPSTLSVNANAEAVPVQYLQQNLDTAIPSMNERPPSVVLSVELLFDQMNVFDSFMWDKFTGGVSAQSVTNIASAVMMDKGNTWSVQKEVQGLLAALLKDTTRHVIFQWANMSFAGELSEVQARHTMFSVSGEPVRSSVRLNITQTVTDNQNLAYWDNALNTLFPAGATAAGARTGLQKANDSSFLNIGF